MLTDTAIRKATGKESPYKLADGGGLHLLVRPNGSKLWRLKYRLRGKERLLSLGSYPSVTIKRAREGREDAKEKLRLGQDPALMRKLELANSRLRAENTFEVVARDWHVTNKSKWSKVHANDVLASLERDIFPDLGALPIATITPPLMLAVLRKIEARPAIETARRVRQRCSAVFVYAIASGIAETDPAAIVERAMAPLPTKGRQPALTDLNAAREMLRRAEAEPAHPVTKLALRLLALTVVRPGELRGARWEEFEDDLWTVPPDRLKLTKDRKLDEQRSHLVPLSRQAREIVEVLRTQTGRCPFIFPNARHAHSPMSSNALGYLLNRAGYHGHHVPHGWRSTFSTIMNEEYPDDARVIDFMLAHVPKDKVEAAYNRAQYLPRRRELAQIWADKVLEGFKPPAELLIGRRR